MAIDLNKNHYSNGKRIRSITPEKDVPEIYPQRETYPDGKNISNPDSSSETARRLADDTQAPAQGYDSAEIFGKKAEVLGQKIGSALEEFFGTTDENPPQNNAPVQNADTLRGQNTAPRSGEYYSGNAAYTEYKDPEQYPEKHFEVADDISPNPNNYQMMPPPNQTGFAPAKVKKKKKKSRKGLTAIFMIVAIVALSGGVREIIRDFVSSETPLIGQISDVSEGDFSVPATGVEKLKIESDNLKINVNPSDGDEFEVSYSTHSDIEVLHSVENGVLRIYTDGADGFHLIGFMDFSDSEINVSVPSSYAGDINVVGKNGGIELEDISTEGNIICENVNGAVRTDDINAGGVKLSSENARIEMDNVNVSGSVAADSTNGRITAEGCNFESGAEFTSTNGRIETHDCTLKGDSIFRSNNGRCEFTDLTVENLTVKTQNGAISGDIEGRETDYRISAKAKNGSCNLSDTTTGKYSLELRSENGSINVDFDE